MEARSSGGYGAGSHAGPATPVGPNLSDNESAQPRRRWGAYTVELRPAALAGDLADEWRALADRAIERNVFAGPDFVLGAALHLPEARSLQLLIVREREILRAVFPILLPRLPLAPGTVSLWCPPGASAIPLVDREAAHEVIGTAFAWLSAGGARFSAIDFSGIRAGGPFATALHQIVERSGLRSTQSAAGEGAVLAPARGSGGTEPPRTSREALRDRLRKYSPQDEITFERAREPRAVRNAIEDFLALEAGCAAATRRPALIQDPGRASFVRTLTRRLARTRDCLVDVLRIGGRPAACAVVLRSGDEARLWLSACRQGPSAEACRELLALEVASSAGGRTGAGIVEMRASVDQPGLATYAAERIGLVDVLVALRPAGATASAALHLRALMRRHAERAAARAEERKTPRLRRA